MPELFCFGFGYCAQALARSLDREAWRIAGTARNLARARRALPGVAIHAFDGDRPLPDFLAALKAATHVLVSVPPEPEDAVLRWHGRDLAALASLRWLGYLSATSVYGDCGGAWVDETAPVRPSGERGERRAAAEAGWRELWLRHRLPVHIFRLAGLYGPGRSVLDRLRAGTARNIVKPGQQFSRIHAADVAQALAASMARPRAGVIYNLADDEPAAPQDVLAHGARLLGLPVPPPVPLAEADMSSLARSFFEDHRRIDNRLMKQELGVRLRYPTYRQGLAALAKSLAAT
ncbi:MAG: SDR family NAD(P)-dependent oxidoreductase [Alphaproteobacteria bacterium]|nr:SDR family NAD(P)-dependent oxidoreductase [Alphaproteobacteria bacterium]